MRAPLLLMPAVLAASAFPALAQTQPLPIASVTCADLAKAAPAYQAALVFYAAGYRDGVDYANAADSAPTPSVMPSSDITPAAPSSDDGVAEAAASVSQEMAADKGTGPAIGGLVLQAGDVIKSCDEAPNALLTDIVTNLGGARGPQGGPGPDPNAVLAMEEAAAASAPASSSNAAPSSSP